MLKERRRKEKAGSRRINDTNETSGIQNKICLLIQVCPNYDKICIQSNSQINNKKPWCFLWHQGFLSCWRTKTFRAENNVGWILSHPYYLLIAPKISLQKVQYNVSGIDFSFGPLFIARNTDICLKCWHFKD